MQTCALKGNRIRDAPKTSPGGRYVLVASSAQETMKQSRRSLLLTRFCAQGHHSQAYSGSFQPKRAYQEILRWNWF